MAAIWSDGLLYELKKLALFQNISLEKLADFLNAMQIEYMEKTYINESDCDEASYVFHKNQCPPYIYYLLTGDFKLRDYFDDSFYLEKKVICPFLLFNNVYNMCKRSNQSLIYNKKNIVKYLQIPAVSLNPDSNLTCVKRYNKEFLHFLHNICFLNYNCVFKYDEYIASLDSRQRVALYLLRESYLSPEEKNINRNSLASLLCMSRQQLYRVLSEMKEAKLIRSKKDKIAVVNRKLLLELINRS